MLEMQSNSREVLAVFFILFYGIAVFYCFSGRKEIHSDFSKRERISKGISYSKGGRCWLRI